MGRNIYIFLCFNVHRGEQDKGNYFGSNEVAFYAGVLRDPGLAALPLGFDNIMETALYTQRRCGVGTGVSFAKVSCIYFYLSSTSARVLKFCVSDISPYPSRGE